MLRPTVTSHFASPILSLRKLTACVEGRTILRELDLEIGLRGVYALMGPGGSGKSSLIGILGGRNRAGSGWTMTGELLYDGAPLGSGLRPPVVGQKLQRSALSVRAYLLADLDDGIAASFSDGLAKALLTRVDLSRLHRELTTSLAAPSCRLSESEWWRLAIARELVSEPKLLCVDEPTAGMEEAEAAPILQLLRQEGTKRAVLFVTHNQQHARLCSDHVILLAAGQLQEIQPTADFFASPISQTAQDYVRTGGCYMPVADATADLEATPETTPKSLPETTPKSPPEPAQVAASALVSAVPVLPVAEAPQVIPQGTAGGVLWSCAAPHMSLRGVSLRVGGREVWSNLSFDIAEKGSYLMVVDDNTTRRFLIRALCGPRPSHFQWSGTLLFKGQDLLDAEGPATPQASAQLLLMKAGEYVSSNLRSRGGRSQSELIALSKELFERAGMAELLLHIDTEFFQLEPLERRVCEILRTIAPGPSLLVLDDPLAGLSTTAQERLIALLTAQAQQRAILIVAPALASYAALPSAKSWLAGGRLFASPPLPESQHAPVAEKPQPPQPPQPSQPSQQRNEVATTPRVPIETPQRARGQGPRGFQWLRYGMLAGMPAPGLTHDLAYDLDLIRQAGIQVLVTLTTEPLPAEPLAEHGLRSLFFPIEDMNAPTEQAAAELASKVAEFLSQDQAVGFHCKAGLGRTGTMLAAQLIFEGSDAAAALAQARRVEPSWVQSDKQVQFLHRFAEWLHREKPPRSLGQTQEATQ